jgi:hypothetical protein
VKSPETKGHDTNAAAADVRTLSRVLLFSTGIKSCIHIPCVLSISDVISGIIVIAAAPLQPSVYTSKTISCGGITAVMIQTHSVYKYAHEYLIKPPNGEKI